MVALGLPTLAEVNAKPRAMPKGKTRLEQRIEAQPLTLVTEKAFRAAVWKRDESKCRCCGRKVVKSMSRVPERGEVHHIHGRAGDLRFEARAAVLACLRCHERVTGRVNEHRLMIVASRTFTIRGQHYTDATYPVAFREVR